ncbi:hypothetical protein [Sporomusa aerivorans]|uniref:hypothetical protein n=1 Tax=Sporomusa aerivorans TaxID=204936 RepID=UPI00352A534B
MTPAKMELSKSVAYALNTMKIEGFTFTSEEEAMWKRIATGELPRSAAKEEAAEFDKFMRARFPEKYDKGDK